MSNLNSDLITYITDEYPYVQSLNLLLRINKHYNSFIKQRSKFYKYLKECFKKKETKIVLNRWLKGGTPIELNCHVQFLLSTCTVLGDYTQMYMVLTLTREQYKVFETYTTDYFMAPDIYFKINNGLTFDNVLTDKLIHGEEGDCDFGTTTYLNMTSNGLELEQVCSMSEFQQRMEKRNFNSFFIADKDSSFAQAWINHFISTI